MRLTFSCLTLIFLVFCAPQVQAIDGYDHENHTRVTITDLVAGDSIKEGAEIGVFIWNRRKQTTVTIDSITKRGNDLELEVSDLLGNEYFFFDILADDPGLNELPHFNPGMPPPVPMTPDPSVPPINPFLHQ